MDLCYEHDLNAPEKTRLQTGEPVKGRGAVSNATGRYNRTSAQPVDDGWPRDSDLPPKTEITAERPRTIINRVNSPYVNFDRSINPYRGCEHGCIYCFARPSHAHYGLSPGLDFETRLFAKPNAATLLRQELAKSAYRPRTIAIGTNTDPYQPIERRLGIMRSILGVLNEFRHPVSILTKSSLITRDLDLIEPMAQDRLAKAMISITTLDPALARSMEPRASAPHKRLEAVRRLTDSGMSVGVMAAPMIPGLNDHELEAILEAAKDAGARFAGYTVIRLPMEVAGLFREWLETNHPNRAGRVMNAIRSMNGGRDYDVHWSRAPEPKSVAAKLIAARFEKAARRLDLLEWPAPLTTALFRKPLATEAQPSLFD